MEILQTIWNALTMENANLTNIICAPLTFVEAFLSMLLFTTILKINSTKKEKLLYVFSFSTIAIISTFTVPSPYYTFINVIACPLLIVLIFRTNILKAIISELVSYIISLMVSTPLVIFFVYTLKIPTTYFSCIPIYKIINCCSLYLLLYLVYIIIVKRNIIITSLEKIHSRNYSTLLFNFSIGSVAIAIQYYIEFKYMDYIPFPLIFLSLFILLLYFLITLYSLNRSSKLEITTQNLEEEQLYNKTLTVLYDSIRGFKHDFNNIVQGIGGYISTNNMEGLKEYYNEVLDGCQRVNNLALLSPEVINNPAIYSLLTAKYHEATEYNIKINLEVFMDLTKINMKIYQLTRVLGILIDNAIEAARQCEEKEIIITFRNDIKRKKQLFIIENTYTNKDVNIDEIFEKGHTSKKSKDAKNHGLGLWEIRHFIKKNKNLDLYTTKSDKYFKQQFEIYC